jgi:diaminohydroxyphosphoribosylaminopyrimidine deaminase/5-amino-6-(5-phosphoribosylamino)uracil reductase
MNARVNFIANQPKKILLTNKKNIDFTKKFFNNAEVDILQETNIKKVIDRYRNSEINSILVEAGPKLVNSFLLEGLVDELIIYESPDLLGSNGVNWFEEDNAVENFGFKLESSYKIESDLKKIYKNVKR